MTESIQPEICSQNEPDMHAFNVQINSIIE